MENDKAKDDKDDKRYPPSAVPGELLPWFIYTHSDAKSKRVQTFSSAPFNSKSYLRSIPEMRGKIIHASLLGWLLLQDARIEDDDNYSITLWNPFTFKSIHLPPLIFHDEGPARMRCALTSTPCEDDCFVFLFFQGWAFSYQLQASRSSDIPISSWFSRRIEVDGEAVVVKDIVTLNGVLYGISITTDSRMQSMVCFEVASDGSNSFTYRFLPFIGMPRGFFAALLDQRISFMVESCGSIYFVQVGMRNYDGVHLVQVLELDLQNGMWSEVKCLGDRAFLLAPEGCTWCWASNTVASDDSTGTVDRDCVYVFHPDYVQDEVFCCRLNDSSSTFFPCPNLLHPCSYRRVWVTPQCNRSSGIQRIEKSMATNDVVKSYEAVSTIECSISPPQNNLFKLPLHITELTSTYMHLFDYWNFRCTCKIIQSTTSTPEWRTNNLFPLFIMFEDNGGSCRVMDPCRDDSYSCILRISPDFFDIKLSKNGWLLIRDSKSLQFINPFTRERWDLPPTTPRFVTIGISSNPTCSSCLIVTIKSYEGGITIDYLRLGDTEWTSCSFPNGQGSQFYPGSSTLYYSGGFYFLHINTGNLGVFEIVDGEARWTTYNSPFVRAQEFHSGYLVECAGEIISVFIGKNASWIQVFKLKHTNTNKVWVRVKDLRNRILFISHVSCFCEITEVRKMRNRIYLPWLIGDRIVFYSLETQRFHVDAAQNSYKDFFSMKQPFRCCWV